MICLILAGGRGEHLWPLSRRNYPKQFIQIQNNHSLFQETVARNIPYCEKFIIVTNYEYQYIIESQMAVFQGVTYYCVYEEEPIGTAAAIVLACMDLQPSELVFVVASDHAIDPVEIQSADLNYQDAIITAKHYAINGYMVIFGIPAERPNPRYGWIMNDRDNVLSFIEKPDKKEIIDFPYLQNAGLLLFENGILQQQLETISPATWEKFNETYLYKKKAGNNVLYPKGLFNDIDNKSIEALILTASSDLKVVTCGFKWLDVGNLEDLSTLGYKGSGISSSHKADNSVIINECKDQVVVINNVDNLLIVNTPDAVYIGRYGFSAELMNSFGKHKELSKYFTNSTISFRSWGYYEQLFSEEQYRIRRVVIYPGKTIYSHSHELRTENWTIVQGKVRITLNGIEGVYGVSDNINIQRKTVHQLSNNQTECAIIIETACGEITYDRQDIIAIATEDISENRLGIKSDAFVKLQPAFKDYLWGGTKIRDIYGKKCDYDTIAESWELSAHPDGQSIVASGRHKGMLFAQYLKTVGTEVLGWKCQSMAEFPLLIKLIDAKERLSVQVHPNDDYALQNEHQYGKNEMWYILDCEPDSSLYVGFNRSVTPEEVASRVKNNTIQEVLNKIPTQKGDVFFIPAGTVHAIGAGNLICEVQQSSNCTYRLYDYDRRDKYGNLRELHLQKALDVLNYDKYKQPEFKKEEQGIGITLARCKYFETVVYEIKSILDISIDDSRFVSIICLEGKGKISNGEDSETLSMGESVFVKAIKQNIQIQGNLKIILSHI